MSIRYRSKYIDDSAAVDHDTEGKYPPAPSSIPRCSPPVVHDGSDDEDSYEAQVRQQDQRDFPMDAIEAGHEQRLRSRAPYRIPPRLLQSGAATPSRGEDDVPDAPSRPTSPLAPWNAPSSAVGSRAVTPEFIPFVANAPLTPLFLPDPDSRGPTPFLNYLESQAPPTPLFLPDPDSRSPTPFSSFFDREETPLRSSSLFNGLDLPPLLPRLSEQAPFEREFTPMTLPPLFLPEPSPPRSPSPHSAQKKRGASPLSEPPAKQARISQSRIQKFLDVQAEDSDDEDNEQEEEDEETLSDQEFLDDTPQLKSHYPPLRLHDRTDDGDRQLASYYDQLGKQYARDCEEEAGTLAPVVPAAPFETVAAPPVQKDTTLTIHTWVSPKRGIHKGRVAFVLSKRKLMVEIVREMAYGQREAGCIEVESSSAMQLKDYELLQPPSPKQLEPFLEMEEDLNLPFTGNSQALAEGDRVVVVDGKHKGENGYITVLREVPYRKRLIKCAKVEKIYDGAQKLSRKNDGLYIELDHLRRHLLDIYTPIRINDRVRVVEGIFYRNASGRVQEINGDILTVVVASDIEIEGMGPTTRSELSTGYVFHIDLRYVNRDFRPGDIVRVQRGRFEGRGRFIVEVSTGGALEIFETGNPELWRVRGADVEWDPRFNVLTEPHGMYSQPTTVPAAQELSKQDQDNMVQLMHTGRRFVGIDVQVVGQSVNKNLRVVVGYHDSDLRAKRLGRQRGNPYEYSGIIVTIQKEMSNVLVDVPIEQVNHLHTTLSLAQAAFLPRDILQSYASATLQARVEAAQEFHRRTPPPEATNDNDPLWGLPVQSTEPTLLGEDTGEWMCMDDLAGKRFDVQLVGTRDLRSSKVSDTVRKLDGTFGHVLPAAPILSASKKVEVYGLGKNRTKHAIDITCVKPRRTDDKGCRLTEISTRVVIVGPDAVLSNGYHRGRYGLTVPEMAHRHGENAVAVRFARRCPGEEHETGVFHISSLCMAKNERIQALHGIFDITDFT
ncbi:hypothetical protein C8R45DRAFT_1104196 [Mycena sanguinolenta]|nr:hypothetical protein C8R45DRAFT_1104196 [Mycena sanguinolenta]